MYRLQTVYVFIVSRSMNAEGMGQQYKCRLYGTDREFGEVLAESDC